MTDEEKVREFLAKKGATKVPAGMNTLGHLTPKDWAQIRRHPGGLRGLEAEKTNALINQRILHSDGVHEWVENGLGEKVSGMVRTEEPA